VVEVGGLAAVGAVDACEAFRNRLSGGPVDDGQVADGGFGPAGLGLGEVLLQRRGLVRQPGHHKVVGHTVTLILNHGWAYLKGKKWDMRFMRIYIEADFRIVFLPKRY